ncbi:MAG: hypothetical protein M0001_05400 [Treponema sp.]|nr:hypothetical protein [Treponema sp.]
MRKTRELRGGLLALALALVAAIGGTAQAPDAESTAQPPAKGAQAIAMAGALPTYDEIVSMARAAKEAAPSLLSYRLVLRFSPASALGPEGEAYRLIKMADLSLRFGISPQETGMLVRRQASITTRGGAIAGMARFLREEEARSRLPDAAFGGPERAAGIIGPGLGRLSWSMGSGAAAMGGPPQAPGAGAGAGTAGGGSQGTPGTGHPGGSP